MKFLALIFLILVVVSGCGILQTEVEEADDLEVFISTDVVEAKGFCVLTASDEPDGTFIMLYDLFSKEIPCDTKEDCFEILYTEDEYRSLAPEFEPYLACEEREDTIQPNKMD